MILVALFAASAVLNYAFGVALAWVLVPSEFGIVSAVQNVLLLAAGLLWAGLPWALARRLAETHGDPEAAKPEFRTALIANFRLGAPAGRSVRGRAAVGAAVGAHPLPAPRLHRCRGDARTGRERRPPGGSQWQEEVRRGGGDEGRRDPV